MTRYAVFGWQKKDAPFKSIISRSFGYLDVLTVLGTTHILKNPGFWEYEIEFEGEVYNAARRPFIDRIDLREVSAIAEVLDENKHREHEKKLQELYGLEIL